LECYVLPILEQGEQKGSHYISVIAMLQQYGFRDVVDRLPEESNESRELFHDRVGALLSHLPEPVRTHRIHRATALTVHAAADRERAQAHGQDVLPFAVYVTDLLDGLVGFLQAPVSPATLAAVADTDGNKLAWPRLV
jgi:hypothetical protein